MAMVVATSISRSCDMKVFFDTLSGSGVTVMCSEPRDMSSVLAFFDDMEVTEGDVVDAYHQCSLPVGALMSEASCASFLRCVASAAGARHACAPAVLAEQAEQTTFSMEDIAVTSVDVHSCVHGAAPSEAASPSAWQASPSEPPEQCASLLGIDGHCFASGAAPFGRVRPELLHFATPSSAAVSSVDEVATSAEPRCDVPAAFTFGYGLNVAPPVLPKHSAPPAETAASA